MITLNDIPLNAKLSIPIKNGEFCSHFGESDQFALVEIINGEIINEQYLTPPEHKPGVFPRWLADQGATHVLAGGMGQRAQQLFAQFNITPVVGVAPRPVAEVLNDFIEDKLQLGENSCSH